tara:strand:- start:53244 stop:54287 length:1044 start_codon:yes stop_codon:yes gene_type:complete
MKLFSSKINLIKEEWTLQNLNKCTSFDFLEIFYKNHPQIRHLFFLGNKVRIYGQVFNFSLSNMISYINNNRFYNSIFKIVNFKILYLTNSFTTSMPSFFCEKKIDFDVIDKLISYNYSLLIIPDYLFENLEIDDEQYLKVQVEDDMILEIKNKWKNFEDYRSNMKSKYRSKIDKIISKTSALKIRILSFSDLENYNNEIQNLFNQVIESSRFRGPNFNVSTFSELIKKDYITLYGYFHDNKIVGFSSEIYEDEKMFSYYVGFDKKLNKQIPIYGRILIENIKNAIELNKSYLILGRTANEFKSNFGAKPINSYIYIFIRNKFFSKIFRVIIKKIKINEWNLRNPFQK